jgi:hypothetical protein
MNKRRQWGGAMFEYYILAAFVVASVLTPVYNNKTAPVLLMDAIKEVYAGFSYAVSLSRLPTP